MMFSAVILAGGRSVRMGRDKAFLSFNGRCLIEHSIALAREAGADEVVISGRAGQDFSGAGCRVLLDAAPGCGPLGGIERALGLARLPLVLVLAVDLPHMTPGFLRWLLRRRFSDPPGSNESDEVLPQGGSVTEALGFGAVPSLHGKLEPLVAFYPKAAHGIARQCLSEKRYAARQFAESCVRQGLVRRIPVPVQDERCFLNWNTPADLAGD
jgi:molybdopterin-guanine dinucleotide biosynthesis protein A